jgi:hypothetical protein
VFISTISPTTGQAIETAFLILMPQILLSGMIVPLDAMAAGVRWIGYLLPLTYFTIIAQVIMLRGASIASLWYAYVILAVMAVVVFTAATLRFRRDLAPAPQGSCPRPTSTKPNGSVTSSFSTPAASWSRAPTTRYAPTSPGPSPWRISRHGLSGRGDEDETATSTSPKATTATPKARSTPIWRTS